MTAILLNVIEPPIEYGLPTILTLTTNVPAMIFYTLDGTTPTTSSSVYISPIQMPSVIGGVTFKAFATNGTDSSPVFSNVYMPPPVLDITGARVPFAKANILTPRSTACGSKGDTPQVLYSQPPELTQNGYAATVVDEDGYGYVNNSVVYPARQYDSPIPTYNWQYSESDAEGQTSIGNDIGTLPAKTKIVFTPPSAEQSYVNKATYDPKALVIFHDSSIPNENSNEIFRPYFNGINRESDMYGSSLSTRAFGDGASCPSGTFLKYYYNPTKNTITFYYRDSISQQWIISTEQVKASPPSLNQPMYNFIGPNVGDKNRVYRWMLYKQSGIL